MTLCRRKTSGDCNGTACAICVWLGHQLTVAEADLIQVEESGTRGVSDRERVVATAVALEDSKHHVAKLVDEAASLDATILALRKERDQARSGEAL